MTAMVGTAGGRVRVGFVSDPFEVGEVDPGIGEGLGVGDDEVGLFLDEPSRYGECRPCGCRLCRLLKAKPKRQIRFPARVLNMAPRMPRMKRPGIR